MNESSYGLIVEGIYDEGVYRELIRKIAAHDVEVVVRSCGGVTRLQKRFPGFLKELQYVLQGGPVDKALVVRDWKGPDLVTGEQEMANRVQGRIFRFPRTVQFCCVRQETESWLLADVNAVNRVAQERGGITVSEVHNQIEEIADPKIRLIRLLSEAKLAYDPEVCRLIAEYSSLDMLRYRCESFCRFETKVTDC